MKTISELLDIFQECQESSYDGKCRCVKDSSEIKADGEMWAVISDHGNAEIAYKGLNGHIYWVGGIV